MQKFTKQLTLRIFGGVIGLAAVVFVAREVVNQWPEVRDAVSGAKVLWVASSVVVFVGAEFVYACVWPFTLRTMGFSVSFLRGAGVFVVAQMGKFIPGSIWHAVGRIGMSSRLSVDKKSASASMFIEAGCSVGAALLIGVLTGVPAALGGGAADTLFLGGAFLAAAICALGVASVVVRRLGARLDSANWTRNFLAHLLAWSLYGLGATLFARSIGVSSILVAGAFTVSWVAGFLVIGVPAGLGVREAVMIAILSSVTSNAEAVTTAVGTRGIWTLVQIVAAFVGLGVAAKPASSKSQGLVSI